MSAGNDHGVDRSGRRAALVRGFGLAAGAAVVWIASSGARAAVARKLDPAAVQYVDVGSSPGKDCDDCIQFVPGAKADAKGTCKIVDGPISPHGHCIAFSPKPRPARNPAGISGVDPRLMT
jgi:hypothetical protein